MTLTTRLDEFGRPGWIALMVVSFVLWWPVGLIVLGYLVGSGRMGCGMRGGANRWQRRMDRMQQKMNWMQAAAERWCGPTASQSTASSGPTAGWSTSGSTAGSAPSSGNRAFDDYRADTLRRLEEEQGEFLAFLDRLRHARDKAEFDQFMNERRQRPDTQRPDTPMAPSQG